MFARTCERRTKLQNIAYRCTTEAIDSLIIIADDAKVGAVRSDKLQEDLLLDRVRILIFIHHHIGNLLLQGITNGWMITKQLQGFALNGREVKRIGLFKLRAIELGTASQGLDGFIWSCEERLQIECFCNLTLPKFRSLSTPHRI